MARAEPHFGPEALYTVVDFKSIDDRTNLAGTNRLELLMFRLGDRLDVDRTALYGINVFKVRELMVLPALTNLPEAHPCLRGVASIRGRAVPVIDLNRYCGFSGESASPILVITEFNGSTQGFLVEEVDDIVRLEWNDIDEPPELLANAHDNLLTAVSRLDDKRMLLIIDVERVIADVLGAPDIAGDAITEVEAGEHRTVFFADDSAVARAQVGRILDKMNLRHRSASNGRDALAQLMQMADEAEQKGDALKDSLLAIVTDIEMPQMDGYVLTGKLKADRRFDGVPVMMHSSLSATENRRLGMKVGADGYMPKLRPEDFSVMLSELIGVVHPDIEVAVLPGTAA